jgi:anti-sigma regulatory factor (Ser/Thr protein kinase)
MLRMTLRHDLAELARLRRVAAPFLEECGASPRTMYRTSLALEEAVSNVVRHARGVHAIGVELAMADEGVDLVIEDDGPAFDPLEVPPPDTSMPLEERPIGGLGIHLLRQMTDGIRYERVGPQNRLSIRIRSGG